MSTSTRRQPAARALAAHARGVTREPGPEVLLLDRAEHVRVRLPGVVHDLLLGRDREDRSQRRVQQRVEELLALGAAGEELLRERAVEPVLGLFVVEEGSAALERDRAAGQ